jgi:predicted dehydrogenase
LNFLSDYFQITYLCDVSQQALEHCAAKVTRSIPKLTQSAQELCASPDVDAVIISNATAFHATHAICALQNDKHVFVEKPLALCYRDIDALKAAEGLSRGKVFVGYMRRYAPAFLDAVAEVGTAPIQYARVRDIIGPNSHFVNQSGTFPKKFYDARQEDVDQLQTMDQNIAEEALLKDYGVPLNPETQLMLVILGGLGSHDLSAMREALGMPRAVLGASLHWPVWSALFQYDNFPVIYESGINDVPTFDAHIEIYTARKIVRVNYDTPYVKGLPTTMTVRELAQGPSGEPCYQERMVRTTYEDSYTIEFKEWHNIITNGGTPKTTIQDAKADLDIFKMLMQAAYSSKAT